MKSVCLLVQNYYDFDIRVRRKAEALVGAGFSVDVLALRGPDQPKHYTLNGVNVETTSLGKKRGGLARYAFEYIVFLGWCFGRLAQRMPRRRYAVIDVNTLPDFLVFAALTARWMGAKVVLDMHEITPEFYMSKYGVTEDSWLIRLMKWLERISFNFADTVITINDPIEDLLVRRGLPRAKSTVITNAADESRFAACSKPSTPDAMSTSGKFVMIYHGTLTKLYGLDIAIEAFALAHGEMPGAELCILGGGPEAAALKQMALERGLGSKVRLLGMVSPADIPAWLDKSDVGLLPIRRDVFLDYASPNKLAEFIVMGKAVVISRLKAIRHYFSENALAYFEPNDPADLARQMMRVYRDAALRARLAATAKQEYAPICWDIMKQRYLTLIRSLIDVPAADTPNAMAAGSEIRP
jgi:glycosyltransferase involved in cell wall biosynthesis